MTIWVTMGHSLVFKNIMRQSWYLLATARCSWLLKTGQKFLTPLNTVWRLWFHKVTMRFAQLLQNLRVSSRPALTNPCYFRDYEISMGSSWRHETFKRYWRLQDSVGHSWLLQNTVRCSWFLEYIMIYQYDSWTIPWVVHESFLDTCISPATAKSSEVYVSGLSESETVKRPDIISLLWILPITIRHSRLLLDNVWHSCHLHDTTWRSWHLQDIMGHLWLL